MIRVCEICGKEFDGANSKKYCSDECKKSAKRKRAAETNQKAKPGEKKKRKQKFLSINEVLRLGRENGIYGYGEILKAIETGAIKVK